MYDPLYDVIIERQRHMRQEIDTNRRLVFLRSANPGVRQRVAYSLGGMLISFGTHLRESATAKCASTVVATPYSMTGSSR